MNKKLKKKLILIIIFSIVIFICDSLKSQNLYKITINNNKTLIEFNDKWYFSKIAIPVHSLKIWGDNKSHNIAIIEFDKEKHIISSTPGANYLEFNDVTKAISSFTIIPINYSSEESKECLPIFKASSYKTKEIEDNLLLISQKENDFIVKNKCFSCHRLIPAAFALNIAHAEGYNIKKAEINKLIDNFSALQNENGSFYFSQEPIYGIKTTTVSASFIAALLSDISTINFLKIGKKAKEFLNNTHKNNEIIQMDFNFEPFFNNETTSLLFEIIFQKNLYLKDSLNNQDSNIRANNLLKEAMQLKNIDINKKILLLCGIPYTWQISPKDISSYRFYNYIKSSESKISSITSILNLFVLKKVSPKQELPPIISIKDTNFNKDLIIWNCLKELLYNKPKYLDGSYDEK